MQDTLNCRIVAGETYKTYLTYLMTKLDESAHNRATKYRQSLFVCFTRNIYADMVQKKENKLIVLLLI